MSGNSLKTPLGRVRGLGSAKDGTHHFWLQRLTALAIIPLILWLMISIISLVGAGREDVVSWLSSPLAALLLILFTVAAFWHMKLGLQTIIEDYIHSEGRKLVAVILNNFICIALGAACVLATISMHLGG